MTNSRKSIVFALFIGSMFFSVAAWAQPSKFSSKYDDQVLAHTKKYLVSDLDAKMPRITVDSWLRRIVGKHEPVKWKIFGCTPRGTVHIEGETPWVTLACVDASIRVTGEYYIHISMEYGRFESGVTPTSPTLRNISVSDKHFDSMSSVRDWRELPKIARSLKSSLAFFDPNVGQFEIERRKPEPFKDVASIWFRTMEFGEFFELKDEGDLEAGGRHYHLRNVVFSGKSWDFDTETVGGVRYSFSGKFTGTHVRTYGSGDRENKAFRGRLTKYVNGKKMAQAYLSLNFYETGDAG